MSQDAAASMSQDAVVTAFVDAQEQLSANINAVNKAACSASGKASMEEARMELTKLGDGFYFLGFDQSHVPMGVPLRVALTRVCSSCNM
jgi:hypothetical protein